MTDLSGADLSEADLYLANLIHVRFSGANLWKADLRKATLWSAILRNANLGEAKLQWADLTEADLSQVNLSRADLREANLRKAELSGVNFDAASLVNANLTGADLSEANLNRANLGGTIFANIDMSKTKGLDTCMHWGPSFIDFSTLSLSGNLPHGFLRGCGLPDTLINYLPSFQGNPIQFYSCFISYSTRDQVFAERLHADLQNKSVRCWFAPHDLSIGAKTWDAIDEAIRLKDKLLLILSKSSIESEWVEDEVNKAYAEERARKQVVLFPVRIDNAVMSTAEPWAVKLRDQRNIGDFRRWREPAEYQGNLERLLRDLKASGDG